MSELIRAFVAVKVPDDVASRLDDYLDDLRKVYRAKWVRAEQMHITLKFLGELEPEVIDDVKDILTPLKHFEPFRIELDTIGAFPNVRKANVLWLSGSKGSRELGQLSGKVNRALSELVEPDTKRFRAHLTIARLKGEPVEEIVNMMVRLPPMHWTCNELVLMQSVLNPKGPVYTQIL